MIKVAITGSMASGKTFLLRQIEQLGYKTFSSDEGIRKLLLNNNRIKSYIQKNFPSVIINRKIDRKKLAREVFKDKKVLREYEKVIYKELKDMRESFVKKASSEEVVFFEVPLLFEKELQKYYDKTIIVVPDRGDLEERLKERERSSGKNLIKNILSEQIPNEEKASYADFVISGSLCEEEAKKQIENIIIKICGK